MAKPNPAAVLAETLLQTLKAQRAAGASAVPMRLSQLAASSGADAALFAKAIKQKSFTAQAVLAQKKNPDSLVVLTEDVDQLAASDALLLTLLEQHCVLEAPAIAIDKLVKKVEAPLRKALSEALAKRVEQGTLPESVGVAEIRKKPNLYLKRMPPPRPADVELAEKFLAALESRRVESAGFPWTMGELLGQVAAGVDAKLLRKALGSKLLKPRLIAAAKGDAAPVALAEDVDKLAGSRGLLEFALNACRSHDNQAVPLSDLKKKVTKAMQLPFAQALGQRVAHAKMPVGTGLLRIKKQPCFFFWSDALGECGPAAEAPERPKQQAEERPPALDFAHAFGLAFESLDRQRGGVNLVSLADLRRVLPVDRGTFDRELNELRRAGRFSLSGAEGRHGLSEQERQAAIREGDNLLLFVARRG